MDLDDFFEPEVALAVAVTAALASPPVRRVLRRGAVYGLAGLMIAGDRISSFARTTSENVRRTAAPAREPAGEPAQ
jgi:hypothetical protein